MRQRSQMKIKQVSAVLWMDGPYLIEDTMTGIDDGQLVARYWIYTQSMSERSFSAIYKVYTI